MMNSYYHFLYEGVERGDIVEFRPPLRVFNAHLPAAGAPNIFAGLVHGVTFASNDVINAALYEHFERWYCVYPDAEKMRRELTNQILMNGDYWEKMYQTMLLEFNPLHNYDMTETEQDHRCRQSQGSTAGSTQSNATSATTENRNTRDDTGRYGYNEVTPTDTETVKGTADLRNDQKSSVQGTTAESRQDRGRECGERTLTRAGNIGVTTSSQLLTEYRGILLRILEMYINSFNNLFMVL